MLSCVAAAALLETGGCSIDPGEEDPLGSPSGNCPPAGRPSIQYVSISKPGQLCSQPPDLSAGVYAAEIVALGLDPASVERLGAESNWPPSLRTLDGRDKWRQHFLQATLRRVCVRFEPGEKGLGVVVQLLAAENGHLPREMLPEDGTHYFIHFTAGSYSLIAPPPTAILSLSSAGAPPAAAGAVAALPPLPPGWVERASTKKYPGKIFYVNSKTGETSWDRPAPPPCCSGPRKSARRPGVEQQQEAL